MPRLDRATTDVPATPDEVYAAFVDADALADWLPPAGTRGELSDARLRAGGGFTMTLHRPAGSGGRGRTTADSDVTHVVIDATDVPPGIDADAHQQGLEASLANLAARFETS